MLMSFIFCLYKLVLFHFVEAFYHVIEKKSRGLEVKDDKKDFEKEFTEFMQLLNVENFSQLARCLGITPQAVDKARSRGKIPAKWKELARKKLELNPCERCLELAVKLNKPCEACREWEAKYRTLESKYVDALERELALLRGMEGGKNPLAVEPGK